MRRVDHMQQQIGVGGFLERGAEGGDQRVRQPIDETDGVGDQQLAGVGQADPPHQGIERDEQGVGDLGGGARQAVEERRLAGVGISDQRHRRHPALVAALAQLAAPAPYLFDLVAEDLDPRADPPPVHLELRLAGSARADAAAQARQRRAGADQPRQQVLQLGELYLQLALTRAGAPREDVEDELRAIDHLARDHRLQLAQLRRRELVVDDDDVDPGLGARQRQRLRLAPADEGRRVGRGALLQRPHHGRGTGGVSQAVELVEGLLGVGTAQAAGDEADEGRAFERREPSFAHGSLVPPHIIPYLAACPPHGGGDST